MADAKHAKTNVFQILVGFSIFLGFLTLLLFLAIPTNFNAVWHCAGIVDLRVDAKSAQSSFGGCDGGSLLGVSLDLIDGGGLTEQSINSLSLWPPGLSLIESFILLTNGLGVPIAIYLAVLVSLAFATVFVFSMSGFPKKYRVLAGLLLVAMAFSSPIEGWILGTGLMYQEGFATAFFMFSLVLVASISSKAATKKRLTLAIGAGVCLGFAAYFRSIFDPIILFGLLFSISLFALNAFKHLVKSHSKTNWQSNKFLYSSIIFLCAVITMLPWRIFLGNSVHSGNYSWTVAGSNIWASRWYTNEILDNQGLKPWREGGLNAACQAYPDKCKEIERLEMSSPYPYTGSGHFSQSEFRSMLINEYLTNPLAIISYKFDVFKSFWLLHNSENYLGRQRPFEGIAYFFVFISSLAVSIVRFKKHPELSIIWLSTVLIHLLVLSIYHLEARYLIPLKLGAILFLVSSLTHYLHKANSIEP